MNDDARSHPAVWALLPWLANGSATPAQRREADAHLRGCADCRAELAREQALMHSLAEPPATTPDVELGLQRLMQRLDQAGDAVVPVLPPVRGRRLPALAGVRLGLGAVAAFGLAELLLVAAALWWSARPGLPPDAAAAAPYRTLTQREPATDGPRWRVVFQGRQTVGELQALLRGHGLAIVAGPSEAGVFTLGPAAPVATLGAAEADALAARLRQSPGVLFAETVAPRQDTR